MGTNDQPDARLADCRHRPYSRPDLDAFRYWREREMSAASYRVDARIWTPEGLAEAVGREDFARRALKVFELKLTGIAWTDRVVVMALAARAGTARALGYLMYLRDLFRADPDYVEHQAKRLRAVAIFADCPLSLTEFARRRRIKVVVEQGLFELRAPTRPHHRSNRNGAQPKLQPERSPLQAG